MAQSELETASLVISYLKVYFFSKKNNVFVKNRRWDRPGRMEIFCPNSDHYIKQSSPFRRPHDGLTTVEKPSAFHSGFEPHLEHLAFNSTGRIALYEALKPLFRPLHFQFTCVFICAFVSCIFIYFICFPQIFAAILRNCSLGTASEQSLWNFQDTSRLLEAYKESARYCVASQLHGVQAISCIFLLLTEPQKFNLSHSACEWHLSPVWSRRLCRNSIGSSLSVAGLLQKIVFATVTVCAIDQTPTRSLSVSILNSLEFWTLCEQRVCFSRFEPVLTLAQRPDAVKWCAGN